MEPDSTFPSFTTPVQEYVEGHGMERTSVQSPLSSKAHI